MTIRIFNTLTGEKEDLVPLEPGKIGMYVCGVTPYDLSHVGHARVYVAFDVVRRWLSRSYDVKYVRNFTDVDDKIIARANERGEDPTGYAARFIDEYHRDMASLGVANADVEPRVTTHMDEIIAFVVDLEKKEIAYRVPSASSVDGAGFDVYYRVAKFADYSKLSRRNVDELAAGSRVSVDERKESPLDFALWKSAKPGEPAWDSPWGKGRPGWHIECSAMSERHLGVTFDIHGGGKDLIFPHHTNEIAQSEAKHGGAKFARVWMHNGFVNVSDEKLCPVTRASLDEIEAGVKATLVHDGETLTFANAEARARFVEDPERFLKMSKSLGNFFTIRDVLQSFTPEALRFLLLNTQYRNPIRFSPRLVDEAERRVAYIYDTILKVTRYLQENAPGEGPTLAETFSSGTKPFQPWADLSSALDDDFNTHEAISVLLEMMRLANLIVTGREKEQIGKKLKPADRARVLGEWASLVGEMCAVLGVGEKEPVTFLRAQRDLRVKVMSLDTAEIEKLVGERERARADKNFAEADRVRAALSALGVDVKDTPNGPEWGLL
jgi:cysteinyl-tRNA synthetase